MMKYGLHFVTWLQYYNPDDLQAFFQQARQADAQAVELRIPTEVLLGDRNKAGEIRKMAEDAGLELVCSHGYPEGVDMCSPDALVREYAIEHLKRTVEAAYHVGANEIGGVLYTRWPANYAGDMITPQVKRERVQRSIDSICRVMPVAEDYGIQLDMEVINRFEGYIMNTVAEGLDYIRQVGSSHCGLVLDTFHMNIEEEDMVQAIISAKGHIGKIHAVENNRNVPYHNASIPWQKVGAALRDIGYDGAVIIESSLLHEEMYSYNFRLWRDLLPDHALAARLNALKNGIHFLQKQFE